MNDSINLRDFLANVQAVKQDIIKAPEMPANSLPEFKLSPQTDFVINDLLLEIQTVHSRRIIRSKLVLSASSTLRSFLSQIPCLTSSYFPLTPTTPLFLIESLVYGDPNDKLIDTFVKDKIFGDVETLAIHSLDTTWFDIPFIHLNTPYLYVHGGCCQHFVVIRSIRTPSMPDITAPPPIPHIANKDRKCRLCDTYKASMYLLDCRIAPDSPCFICGRCYEVMFPGLKSKDVLEGQASSVAELDNVQLTPEQAHAWGSFKVYPVRKTFSQPTVFVPH